MTNVCEKSSAVLRHRLNISKLFLTGYDIGSIGVSGRYIKPSELDTCCQPIAIAEISVIDNDLSSTPVDLCRAGRAITYALT